MLSCSERLSLARERTASKCFLVEKEIYASSWVYTVKLGRGKKNFS